MDRLPLEMTVEFRAVAGGKQPGYVQYKRRHPIPKVPVRFLREKIPRDNQDWGKGLARSTARHINKGGFVDGLQVKLRGGAICVLAHVYVAYSAVRKLPVHTKPQCYGTLAQAASVVEWAAKQAFDSIRQSLGLDRLLVLVGRQARSRISRMCVCVCAKSKGRGNFDGDIFRYDWYARYIRLRAQDIFWNAMAYGWYACYGGRIIEMNLAKTRGAFRLWYGRYARYIRLRAHDIFLNHMAYGWYECYDDRITGHGLDKKIGRDTSHPWYAWMYRRVIAMHHIRRARAPTHTQPGLIIKQSPRSEWKNCSNSEQRRAPINMWTSVASLVVTEWRNLRRNMRRRIMLLRT